MARKGRAGPPGQEGAAAGCADGNQVGESWGNLRLGIKSPAVGVAGRDLPHRGDGWSPLDWDTG